MPQRTQVANLLILHSQREKMIRWSMSLNEIGGICFGKNNTITNSIRIPNELAYKKNHYLWSESLRAEYIKSSNLIPLAYFHSHPSIHHLRRPSKEDILYFPKKLPHLIVFPNEKTIGAWMFHQATATKINLLTVHL